MTTEYCELGENITSKGYPTYQMAHDKLSSIVSHIKARYQATIVVPDEGSYGFTGGFKCERHISGYKNRIGK